jgi:hypothetical protein
MKNVNDISEELRSMGSILADVSRKLPYAVPAGFFENFGSRLQITINEVNEPDSVPGWSKAQPFIVPAGYFEALTNTIVAAVDADSLANSLPRTIPFNTPVGYFEALPAQMLKAAIAGDAISGEPKIIPLRWRNVIRPLKWVLAALLVIGIGIGSYHVSFSPPATSNTDKILTAVPNDEIHDYLQHTYRLDVDQIVSNTDINDLQIENRDIVQYLDENGWDVAD